jgi:lipopolysaccharide export system permease protein
MAKILDITNLIVNYHVGIGKIVAMVAYMIPAFLEYVIPISVMIAVLLAFLRMASDSEIIAIESSGMSLFGLLPPVIIFCMLCSIFAGLVSIYGVPWSKLSIRKTMTDLTTQNLLKVSLKERTFIDSIKGITIFISSINKNDGVLHDVFIKDYRNKNMTSTTIAPLGILFNDKNSSTSFIRLMNGSINQVDLKSRLANTIRFDTYDLNLNRKIPRAGQNKSKKRRVEMSLSELWQGIKTTSSDDSAHFNFLTEFNLKFSLPLSCLIFGILALPLGAMFSKVKRSFGLSAGLFFVLLYYVLLSIGRILGESGAFSPVIGVWIPNFILFFTALILLTRVSNNRPIAQNRLIIGIKNIFIRKTTYVEH